MGRGYVAGLWLAAAAMGLIAVGKWLYEHSGPTHDRVVWNTGVVILAVTLVHCIAAWGTFRRRFWGYCSSLAISAYWIVDSAYDFFATPLTNAPRWVFSIPFALSAVALAWLASPALRSQFPSPFRNPKVVSPC